MRTVGRSLAIFIALSILTIPVWGQQSLPDAPKPQPGAAQQQPSSNIPLPPPSTSNAPPPSDEAAPQQQQQQPAAQQPSGAMPDTSAPPPPPPKKPVIKTVPQGGETKEPEGPQERLKTFVVNTNAVVVPVTVKNDSGRPVYGLTVDNFRVLENGKPQKINFFSSDPLGISAAIVIDVGMSDIALKKVQETFSALVGAFSDYDEVSIYTYGATVKQQQDYYAALGERTSTTLRRVQEQQGTTGGAATNAGPMVSGPTVNGKVFNPGDPSRPVTTSVKNLEPPHVLNDAILRAAIDLSHRPRDRRKVIFVIGDGKEDRSSASYSDVLKVLLSNEVQVYALGVSEAATPLFGKLSKFRLPRQPYGDILPKYANATGGEVINSNDRSAIEDAYSRLMDDARNQYTIGYTSSVALSTAYRSIEVQVTRSDLKVYAKEGYYPLPPMRQ
ncbi:MAG: VWA domain-containing protein [Terriglobia bacterium]|jgi:VWFA-related protein|nr:VWA domain-containing protein [Terriglobia bacterium]